LKISYCCKRCIHARNRQGLLQQRLLWDATGFRVESSDDFSHISSLAKQCREAARCWAQEFFQKAAEAGPVKVKDSAAGAREWLPYEEQRRRFYLFRW
jgi:hypothetical protein